MSRKNFRRLFAAAFVFVLLAEWGSHSVSYTHAASTEGQAVYANEGSQEDPCKTLVRCTDGRRQDQKVPNPGHDLSQHNAFLERLSNLKRLNALQLDPLIDRARVSSLFRPPSPPFHPPELS
jgi:hypothetical protein